MRTVFAVVTYSFLAAPVLASPELAKQKNCMGCHAIERKIVGPGYKEIAAKYAGTNVAGDLAQKIIKGSKGTWGVVSMPANPQVSEAEAKKLASWVLSLK